VLRGFQGERIRVLTDGIGSLDVSNTSADHGVTIDPLTAERIEVSARPCRAPVWKPGHRRRSQRHRPPDSSDGA
jgi:hypothetical protein